MMEFFIGLGIGVLITVPLIVVAMRRTEARMRQLDQRARAAERLAELGTLTGGLAHEIKNPLSSVNLNVQLLQEDLDALARHAQHDPAAREAIGRIQRRFGSLSREAQRLRDILEDFLRFAGRVKLDLAPTDLNAMINELIDFFHPQAQGFAVTIRPQLAPSLPAAPADASLLKQAMLNLMINACQAMADSRESENTAADSTQRTDSRELIIRTAMARVGDLDQIEIHVTDTGPGIDPADVEKVFQPYFSKKKGGTGLGLPTSRRIVEEHGGTITVHSELGRGSDFVIRLPLQRAGD